MAELFQDNFVVSVDTNLEDHAPDIGTAWTVQVGASNGAIVKATTNALTAGNTTRTLTTSDDLGITSYYVEATLTSAVNRADRIVVIRAQDEDNFIGWHVTGSGGAGFRLIKVIAGVVTNLITMQPQAASLYRIEVDGTTVKLFEDGIQQGGDVTVSEFASETLQGVVTEIVSTSSWLTNYASGSLGGSGVTVTVDSGTYIYTGSETGLIRAKILSANSGSYSYMGAAVNLLKGFVLSVVSGGYSYLGQDTTLTFTPVGAFILTADSGIYTYTGASVNFNRDRVIIMSNGSYNYNGSDIQIILPGQIWTDKANIATNWTNQTNITTIWTDK